MDRYRGNKSFKQVLMQKEEDGSDRELMRRKGNEEAGEESKSFDQETLRIVKAEICKENVERLRRSIIAEIREQWKLTGISTFLKNVEPSLLSVRSLGIFNFLLTFKSVEDMEIAYGKYNEDPREVG